MNSEDHHKNTQAAAPPEPKRRLKAALLLAAVWLLGLASGYILFRLFDERDKTGQEVRQGRIGLINPLLECEVDSYLPGRELTPFRKPIADLVSGLEGSPGVQEVAVYFRDLDNGPWFGIKEKKAFTPGSLFKVPVVIAALRQAEVQPGFLSKKIVFVGLEDPALASQAFAPEDPLRVGNAYTVDDLLVRVATQSDNAATWLLENTVEQRFLRQVLQDMGFDPDEQMERGSTFTAVTYGRFFRILYNASYLSKEASHYALSLFAQASFKAGLVGGVPKDVLVSHKFGEKGERGPDGIVRLQLHDAGIVYHPARPYLLCVMTTGSDYRAMAAAIARISGAVYSEVDRQMKEQLSQ